MSKCKYCINFCLYGEDNCIGVFEGCSGFSLCPHCQEEIEVRYNELQETKKKKNDSIVEAPPKRVNANKLRKLLLDTAEFWGLIVEEVENKVKYESPNYTIEDVEGLHEHWLKNPGARLNRMEEYDDRQWNRHYG